MPLVPSPAVLRACDVVDYLAKHPDESFSVSELARRVDMPRATCHSVLLALADRGWVARSASDLRYSIGRACISIGEAARAARSVVGDVAPVAEMLAEATQSCVAVLTCSQEDVGVAEVFDHGPAFAVRIRAGANIPWVPPFGAVFAAWNDDSGMERWLKRAAVEFSEREMSRYLKTLAAVRARGYSVTIATPLSPVLNDLLEKLAAVPRAAKRLQERDELIRELVKTEYLQSAVRTKKALRMSQMSAPVFDCDGRVVAALMLLGPNHEINATELDELGSRLLRAAQDATAGLGGESPDVREASSKFA